MKYVIYLRVSTQKQDHSPQLQNCLNFLKSKDSSNFAYVVYSDELSSRKKIEKRIGLQTALSSLQKGDILVSMRLDRLARNLYETTSIIKILEEKEADIMMVDQPGIKNKVLLGLYAGMAEEEVKLIRKRINEKFSAKREKQERISHQIPYGYKLDTVNLISIKNQHDAGWTLKPGKLIEDVQEQNCLRQMVRLASLGYSYRQIATELAEFGYMNRKGQKFQAMSVYRILQRVGISTAEGLPQEELEAGLLHARA